MHKRNIPSLLAHYAPALTASAIRSRYLKFSVALNGGRRRDNLGGHAPSLPSYRCAILVGAGGCPDPRSGICKLRLSGTCECRPKTCSFRSSKRQLTFMPLNGRPCRVIQLLPVMNGEAHYRIRSVQTEHEIAASESELRPLQGYATL